MCSVHSVCAQQLAPQQSRVCGALRGRTKVKVPCQRHHLGGSLDEFAMTSHTIAACGPGLWAAPRRLCRTRTEALLPSSAGGRAELHVAAPTRALTHRARGQRRSCGALAVSPVVAIVAPVIERGDSSTDLMNHLLQNRIIFVGRVITDVVRA